MLEILDIDGKEIELIASLYWNQVAAINIDGSLSDWITIQPVPAEFSHWDQLNINTGV